MRKNKRVLKVISIFVFFLLAMGMGSQTALATRVPVSIYSFTITRLLLQYTGFNYGSPDLNYDGDPYITLIDSTGFSSENCIGGLSVRHNHPQWKELYALFLTSITLNKPIYCEIEDNSLEDPDGCPITQCAINP